VFQISFVFSIHLLYKFVPFSCLLRFITRTPSSVSTALGLYSHRPTYITILTILRRSRTPLGREKGKSGFWFVGCFQNGLILGPMPQVPFYFFFLSGVEIPTCSISKWVQLQAFSILQFFVY